MSGSGLPAGDYGIGYGPPMTDAVRDVGQGIRVGNDGILTYDFVIGEQAGNCYVVWASSKAVYLAEPFVVGDRIAGPGRCEDLPAVSMDVIRGRSLAIGPALPALGQEVLVSGAGWAREPSNQLGVPPAEVTGYLDLYFGGGSTARISGIGSVDESSGMLSFVFTPPPRPDWSGLCVELTLQRINDNSSHGRLGWVRFNYP